MAITLVQLRRSFEKVKQSIPRHIPLTQETYCPRLWGEAFVNAKGEVYYCCHQNPHSLGSLHDASLEELWNGFASRQMRRLALNRMLLCYDRCRLLDADERKARPKPDDGVVAPYQNLKRIKILMGELCNIQCIMCDQDHRSKLQLSVELLKERVDFTNIDDIEIQGGEPLAMKNAKDLYVWLTEEQGKKVNFLTNGTLLPEGWPERLCRGSSWIYVSLNGVEHATIERVNAGAKVEKIEKNVRKILDARERLGSPLRLVAHFTMVPENIAEADRFPAFARSLGFDSCEFGYDLASIPRWLEEHPAERERLAKSFAEQLPHPAVPIVTKRLEMLGLVPAPVA